MNRDRHLERNTHKTEMEIGGRKGKEKGQRKKSIETRKSVCADEIES